MTAVAVLHPTNLQGKELRETLEARHRDWSDLRLLSTHESEIGTLTEAAGAAALVGRYEPEALRGVDLAFFCGTAEESRPIVAALPAETTAILLSLEDGWPVVAGINDAAVQGRRALVSPHPAVVLLAHLLHPLRDFSPTEAVATVIQPASMKGQPGLEELFENSRQIVAMTTRATTPVFGTQLAFNVLPATLATGVETVSDQLSTILAGPPPVTLQILQGAVFHSIAASVLVRCPSNPTLAAFRKALGENPVLEAAVKPRLLGPVDAAASDKVIFGSLRKDDTGAFWLWAVMDNLTRGSALNALEIAEAVL